MTGANEHDSYFKEVFSKPENAAGQLRSVLPPDLAARLDWATTELVPGSFVDPELKARHTDLLFRVQLGGSPTLILILMEHQSTPDPLLVARVLIYMARIWERWLREHEGATKIPPILPFVVSHGSVWSEATSFHDVLAVEAPLLGLLREFLPSFRFVLDDLAAQKRRVLKARYGLPEEARLALLLLRDLRRVKDDLAAVAGLLRDLHGLTSRVAGVSWIHYVVEVTDVEREALESLLAKVSHPEKERIMSTAERLRQEGRLEANRDSLLRQIGVRFKGSVTPEVERRVRTADAARLERWIEGILTAASLDSLLAS